MLRQESVLVREVFEEGSKITSESGIIISREDVFFRKMSGEFREEVKSIEKGGSSGVSDKQCVSI